MSTAAGETPSGAGSSEDNTVTLNKREMRLGLRHRDSFAVTKAHLHTAQGSDRENAVLAAISGRTGSKGQSSVATLFQQAGASAAGQSRIDVSGSANNFNAEGDIDGGTRYDVDDDEYNGLEGGPDGKDTLTINPDSEADIMAALEELAARPGGESSDAGSVPLSARKKNKIKSLVKGIGSALGLRKSKKRRQAEEAAGVGAAVHLQADGPPSALLSPSAKAMLRTSSSPALVGEHEHLAGATAEDLTALSSGRAIARPALPPTPASAYKRSSRELTPASSVSAASLGWEGHEPARDRDGAFLPCHLKEVRVPSILKGSAMSRKAIAAVVASAMSSTSGPSSVDSSLGGASPVLLSLPASVVGAGEAGVEGAHSASGAFQAARFAAPTLLLPLPPPTGSLPLLAIPSPPTSARRGIVFADTTGATLARVYYSEQLHYGENSEHEEWEEDDTGGGSCSIM